jgi:hypothetical protein
VAVEGSSSEDDERRRERQKEDEEKAKDPPWQLRNRKTNKVEKSWKATAKAVN